MTFIPEFEDALVALPSIITLQALLPDGLESLDGGLYRALRSDDIEGAVEEAETWYQQVGADDEAAALTYGVLLLGVDVFDESEDVLRSAQEAHPDSPHLKLAEADLHLEQGDDEQADVLLNRFLEVAEQMDTIDGRVWGFAGDLLLDLERNDEAIDCYETAVDKGTENFETVIRLAELHRQAGHWRRAAECFEIAGDLRGHAIGPWQEAAECWRRAGNLRRSLQARQHVLKARGDDAENWARQGIGFRSVGELQGSIEALEKATRLDPDRPEYWIELAHTLRRAGRLERSMSAYRKVLDFEPRFAEALNGLAASALQQGDVELAESTAREATQASPENADSWWVLGRVRLARHRADEAVSALEEAVQLEPEEPRYRQTLGQAQLEAGDREAGMATLERAMEDGPEDATMVVPYAEALVRQKEWELLAELLEAPADWRRAPRWRLIRPLLTLFVEAFTEDGEPDPRSRLDDFVEALEEHPGEVPFPEDLEEFRRFAMVMGEGVGWAAEKMIDGLEGLEVLEDIKQ